MGLWGYSGGGLATAWATEVHASYAPELNVVGAVLGSPVGNLGNTFRRLNGSFYSGLPAMVVAALSHVYPDLDRVIKQHVTVEGKTMLTDISKEDVQAVVLGCTELSMIVDTKANVLPIYDSTEIHADAGVDWIMGDAP